MTDTALSDLKILECATEVGGPFTTKLLADMGADVIKVEPPGGDHSRRHGPFPNDEPHLERSGQFLYLNANKRGITLNLESQHGRSILEELARSADVLVLDLSRKQLEEWNLGYERFRAVNDQLIVLCLTPYGLTGPYRDYKGSDFTAFHHGGIGYETPYNQVSDPENQPPLVGAGHQVGYLVGWTAATMVMAAVHHRRTYGEGQLIDLGTLEATTNTMRMTISLNTFGAPYVSSRGTAGGWGWVTPCKDGYTSVFPIGFQHWWVAFVRMMDNPEWTDSELFNTPEARRENADALRHLCDEWLMSHTKEEIYELALREGIPGFPVNAIEDVLHSEQYNSRDFWVDVDHPMTGPVRQPGAPAIYSGTPWSIRRPAPLLGEHNVEVICDQLGHTRRELRALMQSGTV